MPKPKHTHTLRNQLWLARKKVGLQRKEVAFLLSHRRVDALSLYERGLRFPHFLNLVKLELIYGQPIRLLFPHHFETLVPLLRQKAATHPALQRKLPELVPHYCYFWERLKQGALSKEEQAAIDQHAIRIVRCRAGIDDPAAL